jgi:hypothetical protein
MKFDVSPEECKQAKIPHEIFLTNLIANHILWFVAALGLVRSYWQPLALVPIVSVCVLVYTLWRAKQSKSRDSWFVMCHWQVAAKRSRVFIIMIALLLTVSALGWAGYTYLGMMQVAVMAVIGGVGILPTMVTVLVLIIMESDALHQAGHQKLPKSIVEANPNPDMKVLEE